MTDMSLKFSDLPYRFSPWEELPGAPLTFVRRLIGDGSIECGVTQMPDGAWIGWVDQPNGFRRVKECFTIKAAMAWCQSYITKSLVVFLEDPDGEP